MRDLKVVLPPSSKQISKCGDKTTTYLIELSLKKEGKLKSDGSRGLQISGWAPRDVWAPRLDCATLTQAMFRARLPWQPRMQRQTREKTNG